MKSLILSLLIFLLSPGSFAQGLLVSRVVPQVTKAEFSRTSEGLILQVKYNAGGCFQDEKNPSFKLELVSLKDITSRAHANNPNVTREYLAQIKIQLVEVLSSGPVCAAIVPFSTSVNLTNLLQEQANSLGLGDTAKKGVYSVEFIAPPVGVGSAFQIK